MLAIGVTVFILGGGLQHLLSDKAPLYGQGRSYHRGDSGRGLYSVGPFHLPTHLPPGGGVLGSLQVATNMKGIILIQSHILSEELWRNGERV